MIASAIWGTVKLSLQVIMMRVSLDLLRLLIQDAMVGFRYFVLLRSTIDTVHENWTYVPKVSRIWPFVS